MKERPLFSVVVPVYNRANTVGPSLESVKSQSFQNYECLVVDDGSSDGVELEARVEAMSDGRFRYIRRENGGGGAARNTGIDSAQGKFVAFLDSDDLFLPNKLDVLAGCIAHSQCKAWYSQALVDRGSGSRWVRPSRAIGVDEDMGEYLFVSNEFVPTPTMVIDAAVAKQIRFDPDLRKGQDLDFCLRLHAAGIRFQMTDQPLVVWRDIGEVNRASRTSGYAAPKEWLAKSRPLLTGKAFRGYEANYLAYYVGWARPLTTLALLLRGWAFAGVPTNVIARQFLRCYLPREFYRACVDRFVAICGSKIREEPSRL